MRCESYQNPCEQSPCENGGSCSLRNDSRLGYHCHCPKEFTGQNCSLANTCQNVGCLNGGLCEQLLNSTVCLCMVGYSGDFCQIAEDLCESGPCLNNGSCSSFAGGYYC
ncbi:jagged-2, partial [Brachionus plicatilis]